MMLRFDANGWQAVVADQFTFKNLRLVTQAICNHVRKQQNVIDNFPPRLVVGYDSRFMGQHFAQIAAEVVAQNGLDVFVCDRPAPTPVVSWAISDRVATGAIMVTGANESAEFNGVKFITSHMAIASEEATLDIESEIEALVDKGELLGYARNPGEKELIEPKAPYIQKLRDLIDIEAIKQAPMTIGIDYLYGIASGYIRELLRDKADQLHESQNRPHSDFGGIVPTLNADNLEELQQTLKQSPTALAIGAAIDGDGSSMQGVDHKGQLIAHDQLFGLFIDYLVSERGAEGCIIKPAQKDDFSEKVARHHGLEIHYSGTADFREITPILVREQAIFASDGLGGYAFPAHIMERDGILATLLLLEMVAVRGKNVAEQLDGLEQRLG